MSGSRPPRPCTRHLTRTRVVDVARGRRSRKTTRPGSHPPVGAVPWSCRTTRRCCASSAALPPTPTPLGRLRIGARTESLHDDLPDALSLAVGMLPRQLADPSAATSRTGQKWLETPGGIRVPGPGRHRPARRVLVQRQRRRRPLRLRPRPPRVGTCQGCGANASQPSPVTHGAPPAQTAPGGGRRPAAVGVGCDEVPSL